MLPLKTTGGQGGNLIMEMGQQPPSRQHSLRCEGTKPCAMLLIYN